MVLAQACFTYACTRACAHTFVRSFVRSFVQLTIASTLQSAPRGGSIPRARRGGARNFYPLIRLDGESEVSKRPRRQSYQSTAERKKEAAISNNYRRGYSSSPETAKVPFTVNKPRARRRMQRGIYTRISPARLISLFQFIPARIIRHAADKQFSQNAEFERCSETAGCSNNVCSFILGQRSSTSNRNLRGFSIFVQNSCLICCELVSGDQFQIQFRQWK